MICENNSNNDEFRINVCVQFVFFKLIGHLAILKEVFEANTRTTKRNNFLRLIIIIITAILANFSNKKQLVKRKHLILFLSQKI